MNESKEIKHYLKNNKLDLESIIEDFTPYISKIIDNMARESLNDEDKEEISKVEKTLSKKKKIDRTIVLIFIIILYNKVQER